MINSDLYILYGFLAFISLLLITILGVLYRQSRDIGELNGKFDGLSTRMDRFESRIDQRMDQLESRMESFEQQLAIMREQVAEIRGMMLSLHERMDLLMRHRHDDVGRVVITPEEVAAD